jgi:hypothetical protein
VDQQPLAVGADADGQRLHQGAAVGRPVAGEVVDVTTPQAVRAVVAMRGADCLDRDVELAPAAPERAGPTRPGMALFP